MSELPSGTVTFLFTDLEGSTRLWEEHPDAMRSALARHDELMSRAIEGHGGHVVKTTGDGFFAAFATASDGVDAAIDAQLALAGEVWPETGPLRVRMAVHTGGAELRDGDYHGTALNRAARLMSIGHGGQVLVSLVTTELIRGSGVELVDLGSHHLRDLGEPERVFQVVHPGLRSEFDALNSSESVTPNRPSNIPVPVDRFVGRVRELREIRDRLDGTRLLTLLGTGGTGKTRLALQVANELRGDFDDRAYFVDLSACRDVESVLSVTARTVGVREESERPLLEDIKERIGSQPMLLVLDNFEQVTAAAPTVAELLRDCPVLTLLVTSREALRITGEQVYPVPSLALPLGLAKVSVEELAEADAVQLFVERARAVRADFELTAENAPAVTELCERLEGLPLAIELATARLALFSPQALVERLGSRLDLLTGGARDAPERQRALRNTIGWSYDLLTGEEQRLLAVLAVFSGATLEAVEDVAGRATGMEHIDVVDALSSLAQKSLLRRTDVGAPGQRLSMLETIREFAAERLGDDADLRRRAERAHAEYFAEWAAREREHLAGDGRDVASERMVADIENLSAAWRYWLGEANFERLGELTDGLWLLYDVRGWYFATATLIGDLLEVLSSTPFTQERLLAQITLQTSLARVLMTSKGYTPETEQAYQRALQLCEEQGEVPQLLPVLRGLSTFFIYLTEFEKARRIGEQLLSLAERFDDARAVEGHLLIGVNEGMLTHLQSGIDHLEQGIAAYDAVPRDVYRFRTGNDPGVVCHVVAGMLLWMSGFPDQARDRADDSIRLSERLHHPQSAAYAHFHTGLIHTWRREPASAAEHAQAVIDISEAHDLPVWMAVGTCLRGAAIAATGSAEEGLALFEAAMDRYRALKTPPVFWPSLLQLHAVVCGLAGRPAEGLALVDEALEVIAGAAEPQLLSPELFALKGGLILARSKDDADEAEVWLQRAVTVADQLQAPMLQLRATLALAQLWRERGKAGPALELLRVAYERFTEGFATADLTDAAQLLDDLTAAR